MAEVVRVGLGERAYDIVIGSGVRERAAELQGRLFPVTDSRVKELYGSWLESCFGAAERFVFPAGEGSKTFETVEAICRAAARARLDRKACFVAVGGGVTGDMTGFAAAIYMRGVDFIQIPTTLLAMVDSSVGGKTGVDLPEGKNLIGAFHQPKLVLIDPDFLGTLSEREIRCGLAEIIKTGVILDAELFASLEEEPVSLTGRIDPVRYTRIIRRCCELKAGVVAADERESGLRAILNYGHTFGHAVEMLSEFSISHGEGVAIGMAAAAELAVARGRLTRAEAERQRRLLEAVGLPVKLPREYPVPAVLEAMTRDKKNAGGRIRVVLPEGIGRAGVVTPEVSELAAALEAIHA